jgi:hypothetical protein
MFAASGIKPSTPANDHLPLRASAQAPLPKIASRLRHPPKPPIGRNWAAWGIVFRIPSHNFLPLGVSGPYRRGANADTLSGGRGRGQSAKIDTLIGQQGIRQGTHGRYPDRPQGYPARGQGRYPNGRSLYPARYPWSIPPSATGAYRNRPRLIPSSATGAYRNRPTSILPSAAGGYRNRRNFHPKHPQRDTPIGKCLLPLPILCLP